MSREDFLPCAPEHKLPELRTNELHVWLLPLHDAFGDAEADLLDAQERARATALRSDILRARYVCAHAGLRRVLGVYAGEAPSALRILPGAQGKPALPDHPELAFNLSHAGAVGLVAIGLNMRIGVDVEEIRDFPELADVARAHLSVREHDVRSTLAGPHRLTAFFAAWTAKEAVSKAIGAGLGIGLQAIEIEDARMAMPRLAMLDGASGAGRGWTLHGLDPDVGIRGAVAADRPGLELVTRSLPG